MNGFDNYEAIIEGRIKILESTKKPFANGRSRLYRILVNAITTIRSVLEQKSKGRPALRPLWLLRAAVRQMSLSFDSAASGVTGKDSVLTETTPITLLQKPLLVRVGENDAGAMEQCIQQFGSLVWNLVKRRVSSHATAEDLVQEIFTEIWKSASRFDPAQGNETTFIAMIARRRVIDWTRRQTRAPEWVELPENVDELSAPMVSTSEDVADHEQVAALVKTLPAQTQQLFEMHFDRGLTQQEIAQCTDLPLGTVKTLLRRGLLDIRARLLRHSSTPPTEAR